MFEFISQLHPAAQVVAVLGLFAVIGVAVNGFFQMLRGN